MVSTLCESCFPFHLKKILRWNIAHVLLHVLCASVDCFPRSKTTFTTPAFFTHHTEFLFDPFKNFGNCMWTGCLHKCCWFSRKLTWNSEQMQFISCVHKKLRQELATYAISVGAHLWNALVDSCQTKRITFDMVYISHHLDWAEKCVPFYKLIFR